MTSNKKEQNVIEGESGEYKGDGAKCIERFPRSQKSIKKLRKDSLETFPTGDCRNLSFYLT